MLDGRRAGQQLAAVLLYQLSHLAVLCSGRT